MQLPEIASACHTTVDSPPGPQKLPIKRSALLPSWCSSCSASCPIPKCNGRAQEHCHPPQSSDNAQLLSGKSTRSTRYSGTATRYSSLYFNIRIVRRVLDQDFCSTNVLCLTFAKGVAGVATCLGKRSRPYELIPTTTAGDKHRCWYKSGQRHLAII